MLQNARVTAFTVFELLIKNQYRDTQIRVKIALKFFIKVIGKCHFIVF